AKVEMDGFFNESHEGAYEILVRAPGYASTIHQMDIPTSATEIPIKLSSHQQVAIQLTDDAGREIPADLIPAVFPESWGVSVWLTAQGDTAANYAPETLLSPYSVNRAANNAGRFTLNIDEKSTEPL